MKFRQESDSIGSIKIAADRYWGAQTQRALQHFQIGQERFVWPQALIRAYALVKKCAALSNAELNQLAPDIAALIEQAADEVIAGELDEHFPLVVFQTGSGTQTNMNVNEVIANRAIELAGGVPGSKTPVHPNDHVNCSQSSNDTFPSAAYIANAELMHERLLPTLEKLRATLDAKSAQFDAVVKVGRTHLQDAAPVTLGQEISAWVAQLTFAESGLQQALPGLYELAIGGTAVGTGLNAPAEFGQRVARKIADATGLPFKSAANKFFALSAHDTLVQVSASLRTLAMALLKISNDIRWLASGPRCGIGEISLPENEPGSSIMPGKVNPTQCEALSQVCVQVFGNDASVAFAGSQGNFQLNVYKPLMTHNVLESIVLLADAMESFNQFCAIGIDAREDVIARHLDNNLMLVTALNPHIGYDKAALIAKLAMEKNLSLREAALQSGLVSAADFDSWVNAKAMTE
jgi:fumarate hydratase class II